METVIQKSVDIVIIGAGVSALSSLYMLKKSIISEIDTDLGTTLDKEEK